ncbi:double-CXXCG motif protein [Stigmatella erecta]|nr:double-CXXCG motif protein [Stigmatella erecta]
MREIVEFRIAEERAQQFLESDLGVRLGDSIRKVVLPLNDERVQRIGKLEQEHQRKGRAFFTYWQIHRRYSKGELQSAELLKLVLRAHFEPTGAMCGTVYDESRECRHCGAGTRQLSDLILDARSLPKGKDIARSIAGEIVVSSRLVEACREHGIRGAEFRPVMHRGSKGLKPSSWSQLVMTSKPLRLTGTTVTGNDLFDLDEKNEYRCPQGHTAGLRQISELYVQRRSWDGSDWCRTDKLLGLRRGELRPEPKVLISQKLCQLLVGMKAKGFEIEMAHVEGPRLSVLSP